MRNRWEGGSDLDEPATITERQLRSLRRGARAAVLAIMLALVSVIVAGWSVLMGSDALAGLEGAQSVKQKVLLALGQQAPTETNRVQVQAPVTNPPKPAVQDSSAAPASVPNGR